MCPVPRAKGFGKCHLCWWARSQRPKAMQASPWMRWVRGAPRVLGRVAYWKRGYLGLFGKDTGGRGRGDHEKRGRCGSVRTMRSMLQIFHVVAARGRYALQRLLAWHLVGRAAGCRETLCQQDVGFGAHVGHAAGARG